MYDSRVSTKAGTAHLYYDPVADSYKATLTVPSTDAGYETIVVENAGLAETIEDIRKKSGSAKLASAVAGRYLGLFNAGVRQLRNQVAAARPVVKAMKLEVSDSKDESAKKGKVHDKKKKAVEAEDAPEPVKHSKKKHKKHKK